ncbi:unnamed protein product [Schistosoma turkestanicum]|nr:unnamed protein product [Schistosoma turkestanicum]
MTTINLFILSLLFIKCESSSLFLNINNVNTTINNKSSINDNNNNNENRINYHEFWTLWKLKYNQYYVEPMEELKRFIYWKMNTDEILLHNLKYDLNLKSYRKSINQYTATDWSEFEKKKTKRKFNTLTLNKKYLQNKIDALSMNKYRNFNRINNDLPDNFDWRDNDTVTPVKTQDNCASSWAMASVEALEGQIKLKTGILTALSAQQLVDCIGDDECEENSLTVAFDYIKEKGVESQENYPFTGEVGNCTYDLTKATATLSSYKQVESNNEIELQKALYNIGPIAVRISMTQDFLAYESGVLLIDTCQDKEPFESVLLIGYGIENDQPYWLVKFSMGDQFADHGYMKLARNYGNMCHIASYAYYPVI